MVVLDALTKTSVMFPVPLAVLPVTEPEVTADTHEKVLPEVLETGV